MELMHIPGPWPLFTNSFLLFTAAGHAVAIDPAAGPELYRKAAAEHGAQLSHILLTHGHYDHVGAVAALRRDTGARVYMDPADALGTDLYPLTPDLIDSPWPAQGRLDVDELAFTVWHTPGHTPGGVCLYAEGCLFSGDTLFAGSCGRMDLPGGSMAELQKSLATIAALPLPDETRVLPGHESFSTLGEERRHNPCLRGELW